VLVYAGAIMVLFIFVVMILNREESTLVSLRGLPTRVLGVVAAVGIGTVGYHLTAHLEWVDAFLNAAMILGGLRTIEKKKTTAAKLFSAIYALFSGVVFIGVMGIVIAPWAHRLLHVIHLERS